MSLRARHRRPARAIAARMSQMDSKDTVVESRTAPLGPAHLVGRALESGNLRRLLLWQPLQ